jgi:ligand-binding SRPBCC domain-containing protein
VTFEYEFRLDAPIDRVYDLLSDVRLLNALTPSWFDLRVVDKGVPELRVGSEVDYRLKWRSLPRRWRSRIVEWCPSERFTYRQEVGPFRHFVHEHLFYAEGEGTRVVDRVDYSAPGGGLVGRLLVEPDLRRIFEYRVAAAERTLTVD